MERVALGVLASGRGSNLQSILDASKEPGYPARVVVVLSDVADAPALARARGAGADAVHVPPGRRGGRLSIKAEEGILDELEARGVQTVALAGFMRILSPRFLSAFTGQVLNIHPSLLPSFPGLHAQEQALRHGARITGCTVHIVDEGIDTGPIVLQAAVPVKDDDTIETLSNRILREEHRIYPEAIRLVLTESFALDGRRLFWKKRKGAAP